MRAIDFCLGLVLAIAVFVTSTLGIHLKANFYSKTLMTMSDCDKFSRQSQYQIAKADAYYNEKDKNFYLDATMKQSLIKCAEYHKQSTLKQLSTIIYKLRNVKEYSKNLFNQRELLEGAVDAFIEIIPEVTFFIGPDGSKNESDQSHIDGLATSWAIIKPSEKENRITYYPQEFFNQLGALQANLKAANKYIKLNGWHLRNIPFVPSLSRNILDVYSGIIVYVERKNAHFIGKNEVVKFLNGSTTIPVWYDMPGSPDVAGASQVTVLIQLIPCVLIMLYLSTVWMRLPVE